MDQTIDSRKVQLEERKQRALDWKKELREKHLNRTEFIEAQKKQIEKNKDKIISFEKARDKEYKMATNMDNQWKKYQKENRIFIKKISPLLSYNEEIDPYIIYTEKVFENYGIYEDLEFDPYLEIENENLIYLFANLLKNYFKTFRLNDDDKANFLNYMVKTSEILSSFDIHKKIKFNPIWSTYTINLIPLQARMLINQVSSFDLLSMTIFYANLGVYAAKPGGPLEAMGHNLEQINSKLVENFLEQRIISDIKFIKLDLDNATPENIREYLLFERNLSEQIKKTTFFNFSEREKKEAKIIIVQTGTALSLPFYADFEEEILKDHIFYWMSSLGLEGEKDYKKILELMNDIYPEVKNFFEEPDLTNLIKDTFQLRLRYLNLIDSSLLLKEEFKRQKINLFRGSLIYWTNFIYKNDLSLDEVKVFFKILDYVRNLKHFIDIFGKPYPFSGADFYMSNLSFWGQWAVNEYHQNNQTINSIKKTLNEKFELMSYIYSLDNYKKIYGNIPLSKYNILDIYDKKEVQNYISTLSFFADWMLLNNLTKEYVNTHFENLYLFLDSPFKNKLYEFYSLLNININLDIDMTSLHVKNHILGIYSSWVNYFQLRGYVTQNDITKALNEIINIANLSKKYNLNFNQDQIKYWFHRKYEKGYTQQNLEIIFKNISKTNNLLENSVTRAIEKIQDINFAPLNLKHSRSRLIREIKKLGFVHMFAGERQRLAEELMLPQQLKYYKLVTEYAEGIIIDAFHSMYYDKQLLPRQIHKYSMLFKSQGYSLEDILKFIDLKFTIMQTQEKLSQRIKSIDNTYPKLSEEEINGFLIHIFSEWSPPYRKRILRSFKLIYILQNYFYKEHGYYLDPQKALNIITARDSDYKFWQIKLLVQRGQLNRESDNLLIINLGNEFNLLRFLLTYASKDYSMFLDKDILGNLKKIFYSPSWYGYRNTILNTLQQINILHENIVLNLITAKSNIDNILTFTEIDAIFSSLEKYIYNFVPALFEYNKKGLREKHLKRRNEILNKQREDYKDTFRPTYKKPSEPIEKKHILKKLTKNLYNQALEKYNIELTPNQISSLLWKIREGYNLNDVLKIYVKDKTIIDSYYKNAFNKTELNVIDDNITTYLAEHINFYPITLEQLNDILKFAKIIDSEYLKIFQEPLEKDKTIIAAHRAYYSGINPEFLKKLFGLTSDALEITNLYNLDKLKLSEYKMNLINLFSEILDIEVFDTPLEKIYPDKLYHKVLSSILNKDNIPDFLNSKKAINYISSSLKETNQSPYDFQMLAYKAKKLANLLEKGGYKLPFYNLLIFSDMSYLSFSNRLYIIDLVPDVSKKIAENKKYYWSRLKRNINNLIIDTREKIISEYLNTALQEQKDKTHIKDFKIQTDISLIANKIATISLSVLLYLFLSVLMLILVTRLFF